MISRTVAQNLQIGLLLITVSSQKLTFTGYAINPFSAFKWVPLALSQLPHQVPPSAIRAGTDIDGTPIYVGRAIHGGDTLPAKVIPSKNACYVAHGGLEILKDDFEVILFSRFCREIRVCWYE